MVKWLVALLLVGCGSKGPEAGEPRATGELKVALAQPDYPAAYRLMPPAFRDNYSEEEFVRMMMGEVVVPRAGGAEPEARKAQPAPDTPRAALEAFLVAYRGEQWEAMLQLVPDRYRERLDAAAIEKQFQDEHNREMMEQIAEGVDGPIEERGDRAILRYGGRFEVKLVRENGRWKIEDID